jgi:hypothetical protein
MSDLRQYEREQTRWHILVILQSARPVGATEVTIQMALRDLVAATPLEVRQEMRYLEQLGLIRLSGTHTPRWSAEILPAGVDLVEYTTPDDEVPRGIARPRKYW